MVLPHAKRDSLSLGVTTRCSFLHRGRRRKDRDRAARLLVFSLPLPNLVAKHPLFGSTEVLGLWTWQWQWQPLLGRGSSTQFQQLTAFYRMPFAAFQPERQFISRRAWPHFS